MTTFEGRQPLPLDPVWDNPDEYVTSLLRFVTISTIFQNLCGGVHVLDFLARTPDLYSTVLPIEWREWFDLVDVHDLLHILLRIKTNDLRASECLVNADSERLPPPPLSLIDYVYQVRIHSLDRSFPSRSTSPVAPDDGCPPMPRHVAVGMKPKKIHEVTHFASYVASLSQNLDGDLNVPGNTESPPALVRPKLRIVDFGSGQNYLGRTLASSPYNRNIVAIEGRHHNVDGARGLDVQAKLAKKEKVLRNKKEFKRRLALIGSTTDAGLPTPPEDLEFEVTVPDEVLERLALDTEVDAPSRRGSMTHIEHHIVDGELESIIYPGIDSTALKPPLMTVSLHSCGNLTHHALRSILNPSVKAVAAIGCCYNLLTERLGPLTYKHPQLRPLHPRLVATGTAYDPQGFPMSKRLEDYEWIDDDQNVSRGIRMNITARMMAVQAPQNWGKADSEAFFTRHFYRALLQKVLLDHGVVKQASLPSEQPDNTEPAAEPEVDPPLIVGSLRKSAFESFPAYVTAALARLTAEGALNGRQIAEKTRDIDAGISSAYENDFGFRRKHLALIWSLMAFSAGVVESLIAVDRWLWLREQPSVGEAWVETVFDYSISPRNLCVVGLKKYKASIQ